MMRCRIDPETLNGMRKLVENNNEVNIVTHDSRFHADEVFACAQLKYYYTRLNPDCIVNIIRIPHANTILDAHKSLAELGVYEYNFMVDTGGMKGLSIYFDHHQSEGGDKSSAGLVYQYLLIMDKEDLFNFMELETLISSIDYHDTGANKAKSYEVAYFIESLYNPNNQARNSFMSAVDMVGTSISTMVDNNQYKKQYVDKVSQLPYIPTTKVLYCKSIDHIDGWSRVISKADFPDVDFEAILYPVKGTTGIKWVVKTLSKTLDSFEKAGRDLPICPSIDFVHREGFIATDSNFEKMIDYIKRHLSDKDI